MNIIQGLLYTGKTLIANTIRNINININISINLNPMFYHISVVLRPMCYFINQWNHTFQYFDLQIFHNPPNGWKEKNDSSIIVKYEYWKNIFTLLMNEDNMVGRQFLRLV